jgi:hypothetical protein
LVVETFDGLNVGVIMPIPWRKTVRTRERKGIHMASIISGKFAVRDLKGDAVIRDNAGAMYRAGPYPPDSDHRMHRSRREGREPFA